MKELLYGAAYYDEYMPYDRLEKDVAMMKKAGINTVRIAESTWSTCEPQEGVFDFSHVIRVMDAMEEAGINVIIGTPTYAVPTWMVKAYPDVLAETVKGRGIYGARQIMDITHPVYRYYAERVIRKLMEVSAHRKCVIGFQLDNETKYYGTAGKNVQLGFVKYLREKFNNDLDALNHAFGLDYWSNRINAWEDFPDVRGTINGSLGAEFEKYQRSLVEEFLGWQAEIVSEYKREDQFITHNLDFEWRGYSYGVQPDVDHFKCAKHLTFAGVDIYHPTQDALTGAEIAFGGDLIRSLKNDNYLVLETEAQGYPGWTPYDGQLRLQAYSHLATGALGVMYWHWHSIHNSFETYWRGLLSHDMEENAVYREACIIGNEFRKLSPVLSGFKKNSKVAIMVNNESLTALKWFGIEADAAGNNGIRYNDVVRWIYDALYKMNIECDIIYSESTDIEKYKAIILPAMYVADEKLLKRLKDYTAQGGTLIATFKTAFANENVKVYPGRQPHILNEVFGIYYQQFTFPKNVTLTGFESGAPEAEHFMELLMSEGAETVLSYQHPNWKKYAAVTRHAYGKGEAWYIGCMFEEKYLQQLFARILGENGIHAAAPEQFPVIVREGINEKGEKIRFYLNYAWEEQKIKVSEKFSTVLGTADEEHREVSLGSWDVCIIKIG
nr:beta-galactosidase [uncultured Blautia sp.]